MLITAGPTQEPIDAVRYIGNRSSGRTGVALAEQAARRGWEVTLLLGPVKQMPAYGAARIESFRTAAELERLLAVEVPKCDVLIMAAAVADYRPRPNPAMSAPPGKFRRTEGPVTLELEPTPDLIAGVAARRRADQVLVAFALEPREEMVAAARGKLERKRVDLVVANPLETMDSAEIEAVVVDGSGQERATPGTMSKDRFAEWLLDIVAERIAGVKR